MPVKISRIIGFNPLRSRRSGATGRPCRNIRRSFVSILSAPGGAELRPLPEYCSPCSAVSILSAPGGAELQVQRGDVFDSGWFQSSPLPEERSYSIPCRPVPPQTSFQSSPLPEERSYGDRLVPRHELQGVSILSAPGGAELQRFPRSLSIPVQFQSSPLPEERSYGPDISPPKAPHKCFNPLRSRRSGAT